MKRCLGCMECYGDEFQICPHCGYIEGTPAEEKIHMEPGTLLHNRYIVGRVLGYGGFGVTYIGWDGKLEQKVAIKEYLPGEFSTRMPGQSTITVFSGDKSEQFKDGMKKFVDEAKRLAKFKNEPGIVKIFDSFEENSTAYIVMEFLDGETLKSYLDREGTLPEDKAIKLLMPVMKSLQTVHTEGILHRDIAPDNIFLTKDGEVKLIDFGASRYATTTHSRSLTVIIKPGFSAEEQYRSRGDQGPYTDVYSIGATLYKMITGKTPPDAMERRAKYENQNKDILVSPHTLLKKDKSKPQLSIDRENAILNAMNVRIEDRTPDVGTLMEELNSDTPVKRKQGKIKRIDLYTWPLWLKITVPTILSIFVILGVLLLTGVIKLEKYKTNIILPKNTVIVPDVEGKTQEEALSDLKAQTLGAKITSKEYEYQAAGVVVVQDPIQGTYATMNTDINLIISKGSGAAEAVNGISTVPFVVGSTKEKALEDLKKAGLADPIIKEENSDEFEVGMVMAQDPEAGTSLKEGSQITITVSKGGASFSVPSVIGKSLNEADAVLKELGLQVTIEQKTDANVPAGQVLSQSIAGGVSAKKGDAVTIIVSSGKPTTSVPNVIGNSSSTAKSTLENAGFKVMINEQYSSSFSKGVVISQSPQANTMQSQGTQITLIVSKGAEATTIPAQSNWSDWTDSLPSYVSNSSYSIEQRTLYRSRNIETISSTNTTMDGWELYDTAYDTGDFGPWSDWSPSAVQGSSNRDVQTKTQCRYRKITYTTAYTDWGGWSDWSPDYVASNDTTDVQTATIYGYFYFQCPNCGKRWHGWNFNCFKWDGGCGTYVPESSWHQMWSNVSWNQAGLQDFHGTGKYVTYYFGERWFKWNDNGTPRTGYRYRTRSSYQNKGYDSWSNWSDDIYSDSSSREVETRTVYRYRDRQQITTYLFCRWTKWSDYTTTPITMSNTREVQTKTQYRYKSK